MNSDLNTSLPKSSNMKEDSESEILRERVNLKS
nr:MAG TPA: hypothetical protein [Caudoviricetes sp.]DAN63505.1 MAG TPA: hypothetical protein [Caudoviricetes sp.]